MDDHNIADEEGKTPLLEMAENIEQCQTANFQSRQKMPNLTYSKNCSRRNVTQTIRTHEATLLFLSLPETWVHSISGTSLHLC